MSVYVELSDASQWTDFCNRKRLDDVFSKYDHEMRQHVAPVRAPLQEITEIQAEPEPALLPPTSAHRAQVNKLSSMLQGSASESDGQDQDRIDCDEEGAKPISTAEPARKTAKEKPEGRDFGVEIPVKKFYSEAPPEPETRRSTRNTNRQKEKLDDVDQTANKFDSALRNDPFRKHWKKPLVYPKVGKKKEEVTVVDRDRLRGDQFLNDNLITFYIRFLQDHLERTNPDAAKRVYFFNSYFFDTLTNKGTREINYAAVEKWTRSVDLFSYDYIVVPINQNAHWYVAIICNLPSLAVDFAENPETVSAPASDKESPRQPVKEVQEILESPEPEAVPAIARLSEEESAKAQESASVTPPSEEARQSFAFMSLTEKKDGLGEEHQKKLSQGVEVGADHKEAPPLAATPTTSQGATTKQAGKTKSKKKRGGVKLDPGQPAIVTFDSLDAPRSPTVRLLREYICKEAASKRGMEIKNPSLAIKGMRAQNIPLQPNFSDCGLYLMAYLENFVRSPDLFIAKVLQRQMNVDEHWPPLGSGLLRFRMREFLDQLYREQASDKKKDLMVDQQPISFLLGPPRSPQKDADEQSEKIGIAELPQSTESKEDAGKGQEDDQGLHRIEDTSGDVSPDMLVLVPTALMPAQKSTKLTREPSTPEPPRARLPLSELEVEEIPDSQEMPAPSAPQPKPGRGEKKKLRQDKEGLASSKREQRATTPDNTGQNPEVRIEIQVPRTPPRKEPKQVRQSPRGLPRKS